jgi:hypothetical protein
MKLILKGVLVLLLLPVLAFSGVYLYGKVMVWYLLARQKISQQVEDIAVHTGNGFGGEVGFEVVDSGYRSEHFFWIDSEHLVFRTNYKANAPKDFQRNYVWNVADREIKPIALQGSVSCFFNDKIFYAKTSETRVLPNGRQAADRFEGRLSELEDHWVVEASKNIGDIWAVPSDRYELAWTRWCKPWFRIKSDLRSQEDVPEHRFTYLWEWGWVLRMPLMGSNHYNQVEPEMGFFDIGEAVYYGQNGEKVAAPIDMPVQDLLNLKIRYIHFLDRYWLANRLNGSKTKQKIVALIDRNGALQTEIGMPQWPEYSEIPLPMKKGIFWNGYDYRLANPTPYDIGAFIKVSNGGVYKVIKGDAIRPQLSTDGCRVAFFNRPSPDRVATSLKVFNVCNSKLNQKDLRDYDY